MRRIATATAVDDLFGSGKKGFGEGDPAAGQKATDTSEAWFNDVQEELAAFVEHVGRTLGDDNTQARLGARDMLQLAEWTRVDPDFNTGIAVGWRTGSGSTDPHFVVFDGANSKKTSYDGQTWSSSGGLGAFIEVADVLHTGAAWYAAGSNGVNRSTDLSSWTNYALGGGYYYGIGYSGSNAWVCVGAGGALYTSSTGTSWTSRTSGTANDLRRVAYGDGVWVAVGASGTIVRAPSTFTTWATATSGTANTLRGVAYGDVGGGIWVAVGYSATAIWSDDQGATWTAASAVGNIQDFYGLRWSVRHRCFIAVGDDANGDGVIAVSRDGDTWVKLRPRASYALYELCEADDLTLAVGDTGAMMRTPRSFDYLAP